MIAAEKPACVPISAARFGATMLANALRKRYSRKAIVPGAPRGFQPKSEIRFRQRANNLHRDLKAARAADNSFRSFSVNQIRRTRLPIFQFF